MTTACKQFRIFGGGCKNSAERIEFFIDEFIRSQYVTSWTSEKDSDFVNERDRAERCAIAAEFGADGKTHAEVIEDWRESFKAWLYDRSRRKFATTCGEYPERFIAAVNAHWDSVEAWHEANGSLFTEIG